MVAEPSRCFPVRVVVDLVDQQDVGGDALDHLGDVARRRRVFRPGSTSCVTLGAPRLSDALKVAKRVGTGDLAAAGAVGREQTNLRSTAAVKSANQKSSSSPRPQLGSASSNAPDAGSASVTRSGRARRRRSRRARYRELPAWRGSRWWLAFLTVDSSITSVAAIPPFQKPRATSLSTWRCCVGSARQVARRRRVRSEPGYGADDAAGDQRRRAAKRLRHRVDRRQQLLGPVVG